MLTLVHRSPDEEKRNEKIKEIITKLEPICAHEKVPLWQGCAVDYASSRVERLNTYFANSLCVCVYVCVCVCVCAYACACGSKSDSEGERERE
jgi:hypothetical protein